MMSQARPAATVFFCHECAKLAGKRTTVIHPKRAAPFVKVPICVRCLEENKSLQSSLYKLTLPAKTS